MGNGVGVNAAIESAQSNKELAMAEAHHKRTALIEQMVGWFIRADKNMSGRVSWAELRLLFADDDVRNWLLSSGIDVASAGEIFLLLDEDGTGELEADEFVDNLMSLQGNASAIDLASLRQVCEEISDRVYDMAAHLRDFGPGLDLSPKSPAAAVQPSQRSQLPN